MEYGLCMTMLHADASFECKTWTKSSVTIDMDYPPLLCRETQMSGTSGTVILLASAGPSKFRITEKVSDDFRASWKEPTMAINSTTVHGSVLKGGS